jgi:predicted  nucleic acid-binding Zn-ribbon protein
MTDPEPPAGPAVRLLDLQAHDTHLDQLRHERAALPARAGLVALAEDIRRTESEEASVREAREVLTASQRRLEDDIAGLEAKAAMVDKSLYSGTVTSPRELQDLQADLESLQRRQSHLEDEVIELMEKGEPLDADLARLAEVLAGQRAEVERLQIELTTQEAELDVVIETTERERGELVSGIDAPLLAEYERLRADLGGIGVARFEGGRCLGCQLALSAVERDRIKSLPPDALVHCEECGRLLVR